MITLKYLIKNKKRTFITISSVILVTILFLCIGLLFSSIRDYMIDDIIKTRGNYHVKLETDKVPKTHVKKAVTQDNITYIVYKNIDKTYIYTEKFCQKQKCQNISYNTELLSLYGVSKNTNMKDTLISILITILVILSFCIMIIIYNSFMVSVMERKKQFSILKSIGMTKFKIRNMIILESLIILLCGLFIGFFISVNFMFIILNIINNLLSELFTEDLKLSFYLPFVLIPFVFVILIVILSAFIPAYKASKLNIIENIHNQDEYHYKSLDKLKMPITLKLAYFNYKRCHKKYRPIILCVFISIILYTSFSMYLNYGLKSIHDFNTLPNYDSQVTILDSNQDKYQKLKVFAQENSHKYNLFNVCTQTTKVSSKSYLNNNFHNHNLLIIEGNDEYIINRIKQVETKNNKMLKINQKYLKKEADIKVQSKNIRFKTKNKIPFGITNFLTKDNVVLITNHFSNYCQKYNTMLLMKSDIDLKSKITKFSEKSSITNIEYVDVRKANKIMNNIITVIKILLYGTLALVLLIVISSIINTIWASTSLRSRELAVLKSIGLTQKQMRLILLYESLYVTFKGFFLAVPFVILISYILHQSLIRVFQINLLFPFKELCLSFIILVIVIYLTMLIMHRKFNTSKIVSIITNENI